MHLNVLYSITHFWQQKNVLYTDKKKLHPDACSTDRGQVNIVDDLLYLMHSEAWCIYKMQKDISFISIFHSTFYKYPEEVYACDKHYEVVFEKYCVLCIQFDMRVGTPYWQEGGNGPKTYQKLVKWSRNQN